MPTSPATPAGTVSATAESRITSRTLPTTTAQVATQWFPQVKWHPMRHSGTLS
jgi:hypothetical protein